jgi:hypothetical protein
MSLLDRKGPVFYVYLHYEIVNGNREIVYVGKGSGGRAWDARPTTRGNNGGHNDHCGWICDKILNDVPFVQLFATKILSSEALEIEKRLREQYKPRFNVSSGNSNLSNSNLSNSNLSNSNLSARGMTVGDLKASALTVS